MLSLRPPLVLLALALLGTTSLSAEPSVRKVRDVAINADPLFDPNVTVELGPEQIVAPGAGWPYLFQTAEGGTIVMGHVKWLPKAALPVVFTMQSFDERKTWQAWQPTVAQGAGPITEGVALQLKDNRILVFDVYADHQGGKIFSGKRWVSRDGWRTLEGPETVKVSVPDIRTDALIDDRGEPVSRLDIRRSILQLPNNDLLACAYGVFENDTSRVQYLPEMRQGRSYLIRSQDEGLTWSYLATIAAPPQGQEGYAEPVLLYLRHGKHAGRLICQMRVGREHAIWQTESDDQGRTWQTPHALSWTYSRYGRERQIVGVDPDLIEMSDGTLVMSYGHKPDYMSHGNFMAFSLDQGATWEGETRLNSSLTLAYTGVREISPGILYVVYTSTKEQRTEKYKSAVFDTMGRTAIVKVRRK